LSINPIGGYAMIIGIAILALIITLIIISGDEF